MKAVWFNQLDFTSLCRTSRLELAAGVGEKGHCLKIVGRYRRMRPGLARLNPRPLLLKQWLPDPLGGVLFQMQVLLLAAREVAKGTDAVLVDHFCVPTMLPFNLLAKLGLVRTKFLLDVRSAPVDRVGSQWRYNFSLYWTRLFFDGMTVITDLYREDICRRFRIKRSKIGVWGSGVREDLFDPRKVDRVRADDIRCRLGLKNKMVILYHGYLSPYRGLQEAVKALALSAAQGDDRATLVLLGEGPAASEVRSLAESQGVSDAVRVLPPVPYEEVPAYLSMADVGILPFPDVKWWKMSSPLKLMEYLAMEKPVILTDIAAHREVLGDAECAFYIRDNSPTSIAQAIERVAQRKEILPGIGRKGRKIVLERFTWERQAENFLAYVASLDRRKGK
jgi:glycosyltransferase involved in cell wall biosynthesis